MNKSEKPDYSRRHLLRALGGGAGLAIAGFAGPSQAGWADAFKDFMGAATSGAAAGSAAEAGLDISEVAEALKQALAQGSGKAVSELGQTDGFWLREAVKISLPAPIERSQAILSVAGFDTQVEQFKLTMNRAAESATAEVGDIVKSTVQAMTVQDAWSVLQGADNAATEYLREHASTQLYDRILPIVTQATSQVGVTQAYKNLLSRSGPVVDMMGAGNLDLDAHVAQGTLDGLFHVIAQEEARIRENPTARTTELLKKVFEKQ